MIEDGQQIGSYKNFICISFIIFIVNVVKVAAPPTRSTNYASSLERIQIVHTGQLSFFSHFTIKQAHKIT